MALVLASGACTWGPGDFAAEASDGDATSAATTETTQVDTSITTATAPTTGPGDVTSMSGTGEASTGGDTPGQFIVSPDGGSDLKPCDPWVQDCPEGQKCMPWSGDGDNSWESLKCFEVVRDPDGLYESCEVFGSLGSGEDSCDVGLICLELFPDTFQCIGLCTGDTDAPGCADPWADCTISDNGVLTPCLPSCDPLVQNCWPGTLCIPDPQDPNRFLCVLDLSGEEGQAFDPCQYADGCGAGLACLPSETALECDPMVFACCIPFCDTSLADTCPGANQECVAWHEEGRGPPGLQNVGVCRAI